MKKILLPILCIVFLSLQTFYALAATNTVYLPLIANQPAPTATSTHTPTITPTQTNTPQATATSTPQPTATQPAAICRCDADIYDCGDFGTHAAAQACFDYCVNLGEGDIHKLDRDNDGIACESLPLWVQVWKGD